MRFHRFYLSSKIDGQKNTVSDPEILHQWRNVFRLKVGDEVILFDGSGIDFKAQVVSLSKEKAQLDVTDETKSSFIPERKIHLFQSLIKKDNFEWILEKCTELGVSDFHPVISDRSEKKDLNFERTNKILIEASEQSGRGKLPMLHEILHLKKILEDLSVPAIVFDLSGKDFSVSGVNPGELAVFIGPEGGWSSEELALFHSKKIPVYSLGKQTLRAETAAIAISSLLLL